MKILEKYCRIPSNNIKNCIGLKKKVNAHSSNDEKKKETTKIKKINKILS